jgi:hypothetical protein
MSKKTYIKVSGVWKEVVNIWRKVSGTWQSDVMSYIKAGSWKECMSYLPNITTWGPFDTIYDDYESNPIYPRIYYINDGGAGNLLLEWEVYDSGDNLIDSSGTYLDFIGHGADYAEPWINYPSAGNGYYLKARVAGGSWTTSNSFNSLPN